MIVAKTNKTKGQAMVVAALCMFVLLAAIGLAIDGGLLYGERRKAQNAADAAALAGTQKMLDYYDEMLNNYPEDVDYDASHETDIRSAIDTYAATNGVLTDTITAYFVNDNNQVVTVDQGPVGSASPTCGASLDNPCMVGDNGEVPWTLGATGILVKGQITAGSIFMRYFGFNTLSASASATAFMGVAVGAGSNGTNPELAVFPIGIYTMTHSIVGFGEDRFNDLMGGETRILLQGDSLLNSDNWGYLSFNGTDDALGNKAWLECGYNPTMANDAQWDAFCPPYSYHNPRTWGPTQYWNSGDSSSTMYSDYDLRVGTGSDGWWIAGSSGNSSDNCFDLADLVDNVEIGRQYLVPIIDEYTLDPDPRFHLRQLEWFSITRAEVQCDLPIDPIDPSLGTHQVWTIVGEFLYHYSAGSSGRHGDMRHTSQHTVFLGP